MRFILFASDFDRSYISIYINCYKFPGTGPFTEWNLIETYENDLTETQVPAEPAWLRSKFQTNQSNKTKIYGY